nr:hypothetical protein [Solirubrobacterales bacterium]
MKRPDPDPLGYDVDESAVRFSNYFHVLRELVHLGCGWLALEPRLEVKYALGDHLHDDARTVTKVKRRLFELRTPSDYPGAPADELASLLDRATGATSASDYLGIAYGNLKPRLIAALRIHLAGLDPVVDEPSLRLLTQMLHRQERHVAELPAQSSEAVDGEDLGALPVRLREVRALRVMTPLVDPARDPYVEITSEGDPFLGQSLYVNGEENH